MKLYVQMADGSVRCYEGMPQPMVQAMLDQTGQAATFITREQFDSKVAADNARIEQAVALAMAAKA